MDSLRIILEEKRIYIYITIGFVVLLLVFFLGVMASSKINRGSYRMSVALPTPEAVSVKEPALEEEPKKEAQEKEELQTSTQVPETLEKDEAETADTAIPVPAAEEIFTLGEGSYHETSSAKGRIGISGGYSQYIRGKRWVEFSYGNISKEVLDTEWTVVWKDTDGNVLRTDEGRHFRLLPGDSKSCELQYPEKAISYEFWIEAERSRPIPATIDVNYIEDISFEGAILVSYELEIRNKGTPEERWTIKIKVKNISDDRIFGNTVLYFREKDKAGKVIPAKECLGFRSSDSEPVTEDGFYHLQTFAGMLNSGESKDFESGLTYETASLDFFIQAEEIPSLLVFKHTSTVEDTIKLKNYTITDNPNNWKINLDFSLVTNGKESLCDVDWCKYAIRYKMRDLSGEVFEEGDWDLFLHRGEVCTGAREWEREFSLPRETAKIELILVEGECPSSLSLEYTSDIEEVVELRDYTIQDLGDWEGWEIRLKFSQVGRETVDLREYAIRYKMRDLAGKVFEEEDWDLYYRDYMAAEWTKRIIIPRKTARIELILVKK